MAKLVSNLSKIANQAPFLAGEVLRQTANDIASLTKQLTPIDTGDLQRSYRVEPLSDNVVQIGSDLEYAPYVEFGTSNQSAQPHLVPAFAQNEETFKARLVQAIEKAK